MPLTPFRIAARSLRKQPAFVSAVIVSLALGIALNTTMYGVLDALLRPEIDVRDPGRLYRLVFFGDMHWRVDNRARDAALAAGMRSYESITRTEFNIANQLIQHGDNVGESVVKGVASNYFDVLGVHPLAGRTFLPTDETAELPPVVLDESLAHALFPNGDSPIGAQIKIGSQARVVIGVLSDRSNLPGDHGGAWEVAPLQAIGPFIRVMRLRPGATEQDAFRELSVISNRIAIAAGDDPREDAFRFHQAADPEYQLKQIHYALIAAVVAVLLVACSNLANIQLARGIGRRRELALRSALGASRGRLIGHLLSETTLLAAMGLGLGLLLTFWGSSALGATIPKNVGAIIVEPQISWRVLAFALAATMFCLVVVGLLPSIGISRTDPNDLLKSGSGTGATKANRRRYAALVAVEIALALALSCLAAVAVRATMLMNQAGAGYDPRPLSTGRVSPVAAKGAVLRYSELLQLVASRIEAVPDVASAAATIELPVENGAVSVDDAGGVREVFAPTFSVTVTSPSFVRTFGYPIVHGRDFLEGERDHGAVIVDERTARVLWPNANPVGQLIKFGDKKSNRPYVRVVGVIGEDPRFPTREDVLVAPGLHRALGQVLYLPAASDSIVAAGGVIPLRFVARAARHFAQLPVALRRAADGWGDLRSSGVMTIDESLGLAAARETARFMAALFTIFAAMGVGLAAFGVYGVVAHAVAERRRELGVRVALGATRRDILHAVLRETVAVALAGAAGGLLLTRFDTHLLWQLAQPEQMYDAPLFAIVALVVLAAAAASATAPAIRATKIDPTESLRAE